MDSSHLIRGQKQVCDKMTLKLGEHKYGLVEMSAGYMTGSECLKCGAANPNRHSIAPWDLYKYT